MSIHEHMGYVVSAGITLLATAMVEISLAVWKRAYERGNAGPVWLRWYPYYADYYRQSCVRAPTFKDRLIGWVLSTIPIWSFGVVAFQLIGFTCECAYTGAVECFFGSDDKLERWLNRTI
jgi:hypothetical protein